VFSSRRTRPDAADLTRFNVPGANAADRPPVPPDVCPPRDTGAVDVVAFHCCTMDIDRRPIAHSLFEGLRVPLTATT